MTVLDRFLNYIKIDTSSSQTNEEPSSKNQMVLAKTLMQELIDMGIDVYFDDKKCYLYATIKGDPTLPKIGFIAHLDTSEDASGNNIKANIIKNYDGNAIHLSNHEILSTEVYPQLLKQKGKTLITTDGTTLLGADDKAGIAEIMTMLEHFSKVKQRHGDICVAFTPDEEIGKGMDYFDYEKFASPIAYTVDGSTLGEISYENFNAASARIEIEGKSTHCGTAKNVMVNSILIATALVSELPDERPETTEGYEGFIHLENFSGTVSHTTLEFLIRDFDKENFERRKTFLRELVNKLNEKYDNRINGILGCGGISRK